MPYKDKEKQRESQRKFYKKNKSYYANKRSQRQKNIRAFINDYKSGLKCKKCPENHISCLDFHYKNPDEKETTIANMHRTGWKRERILKEIKKCIVLCANCHRKLHWLEKNENESL